MSIGVQPVGAQRARLLAAVAVFTAAAIMLAGIAMAMGRLSSAGLTRGGHLDRRQTNASTSEIGDDVKTSFGVVAVEYIRSLEGVSSRSLGGATHGVPGLVDPQHVQIQAALSVTNRSVAPLLFSLTQVRLRVTAADRITVLKPVTGDIPDTRVLANAAIEGHIDFVIPRKPAQLTLEFDDPGRGDPILIDLGTPDLPPVAGGHEHSH